MSGLRAKKTRIELKNLFFGGLSLAEQYPERSFLTFEEWCKDKSITDSGALFVQNGIKRGDIVFVNDKPAGCVKHSIETVLTLTKWHPRYILALGVWGCRGIKQWIIHLTSIGK